MVELTILSEALLELALEMSSTIMRRKFGLLRENAFSIIGMGKLGAEELNYSSDIDIIAVYSSEEGVSTGVLNPFGIRHNKISSQEYFCTLTEILHESSSIADRRRSCSQNRSETQAKWPEGSPCALSGFLSFILRGMGENMGKNCPDTCKTCCRR